MSIVRMMGSLQRHTYLKGFLSTFIAPSKSLLIVQARHNKCQSFLVLEMWTKCCHCAAKVSSPLVTASHQLVNEQRLVVEPLTCFFASMQISSRLSYGYHMGWD